MTDVTDFPTRSPMVVSRPDIDKECQDVEQWY